MDRGVGAVAWTLAPNPEQPCENCGHIFGPHVFYATDTSARDPDFPSFPAGGILICPSQEVCSCFVPWGTAKLPGAFIPIRDDIESIRELLRNRQFPNVPVGLTYAQWTQPDDVETAEAFR